MIIWIIIIVIISIFEFRYIKQKQLRKEMYVIFLMAALAIIMAYIHNRNPYGISIAEFTLKLLGYDR